MYNLDGNLDTFYLNHILSSELFNSTEKELARMCLELIADRKRYTKRIKTLERARDTSIAMLEGKLVCAVIDDLK